MAKFEKEKMERAAEKSAAPSKMQERVGIFMKDWKLIIKYHPSSMDSHIRSYRAGQLVFKDDEIESLLAQGAPLRVYTRDAD